LRTSTTAPILLPGLLLALTAGASLGQDAAGQSGLNSETEHVRHMRPRKKPGVSSAAAVNEEQTQTPEKASVKVEEKTSLAARTADAPETKTSVPKKKPRKDKTASAPKRVVVTPDQPSPPQTRPPPRGFLDDLFGDD
jgi:hypothetical protein